MEVGPDHRQRRRVHPAGGAYRFGQCVAKRQAAALADWRADGDEAASACGAQAGAVGKAPPQHALIRQDKGGEIACWACAETDRADHPDRLTGPGKCSVNDPLLHGFSLAV